MIPYNSKILETFARGLSHATCKGNHYEIAAGIFKE
jgi:hypothetical protein